jgi:hypothetical protein
MPRGASTLNRTAELRATGKIYCTHSKRAAKGRIETHGSNSKVLRVMDLQIAALQQHHKMMNTHVQRHEANTVRI